MPNHFHLLVWPVQDQDLARCLHWLLTTHSRRYHKHYGTTGHVF